MIVRQTSSSQSGGMIFESKWLVWSNFVRIHSNPQSNNLSHSAIVESKRWPTLEISSLWGPGRWLLMPAVKVDTGSSWNPRATAQGGIERGRKSLCSIQRTWSTSPRIGMVRFEWPQIEGSRGSGIPSAKSVFWWKRSWLARWTPEPVVDRSPHTWWQWGELPLLRVRSSSHWLGKATGIDQWGSQWCRGFLTIACI